MADTAQLEVLEKRMSALEILVFGNADKDALYPKDKPPQVQCIESLQVLQNKIMAAVAGRKKLMQVFGNLPALRQYMDPAYADEVGLSDEARADVIFAEEEYLRHIASQLQVVEQHTEVLGSEHIKNVPKLSGRLQELSQTHIQQQDATAEFIEGTARLINDYNAMLTMLSKMFVQWEAEITKLEIQAQSKTSDA